MRKYQDDKGDWWLEIGYRSGYGWATQDINMSQEHRDMVETGVEMTLEYLFKVWEQMDEMNWEM